MDARVLKIGNLVLLAAFMLLSCGGTSLAKASSDYPNRPIRLLVGYSAGGAVDTMARILGQMLHTVLGQPVVVENRPGAASMIAADAVAKATPDGYTLLVGESALLIGPHLNPKVPVDPLKALAPVAGLFQSRLLIIANNNLPANSPKELIDLLKADPGRYTYGTSGVGTVHNLGFELLKAKTNTAVMHIPYRGAPQIITDVMNGNLTLGVVSAAAGLPQARTGALKALAAMSTSNRLGSDDVPPLAEAVPGFNVAPRQILLAPAGTPTAVIERLSEAVRVILTKPEVEEAAARQGVVPAYLAAEALGTDMVRESKEWLRVIKAQKVTGD